MVAVLTVCNKFRRSGCDEQVSHHRLGGFGVEKWEFRKERGGFRIEKWGFGVLQKGVWGLGSATSAAERSAAEIMGVFWGGGMGV